MSQYESHVCFLKTISTISITISAVLGLSAAFSISSENSQVVLIAISSAVAIILLTVLLYVLIGRSVHKPVILNFHPCFINCRNICHDARS